MQTLSCPQPHTGPSPRPKVMLIDDDDGFTGTIGRYFVSRGFGVLSMHSQDFISGLNDGSLEAPHAIVMELVFEQLDGLLLVPKLRHRVDSAMLICTGTRRVRDASAALYLGADSFVRKPCEPEEVFERVLALLRRRPASAPRSAGRSGTPVVAGALALDASRGRAAVSGEPLCLTPTEFRLLLALARAPAEVVRHNDLARRGWNYTNATTAPAISVHIQNVRAKLRKRGSRAPAIVTLRGVGYMLVPR